MNALRRRGHCGIVFRPYHARVGVSKYFTYYAVVEAMKTLSGIQIINSTLFMRKRRGNNEHHVADADVI